MITLSTLSRPSEALASAEKSTKTTQQQSQIGYNQRVPNVPTILVFDSGLGGLTVLREIVAARPDAHYVYVADDAFFPYGHHGEDEIIARVVPLVGELIAAHAPDLIVIACNTASTLGDVASARAPIACPSSAPCRRSSRPARSRRPSASRCSAPRPPCSANTPSALIRDFAQGCEVTLVGSADLASLAEAALSGNEVSDAAIAAELAPCFVGDPADETARTDTVVLACTHYPLLLDRLVRLAPWPVDWIDPAPAIARRVSRPARTPGRRSRSCRRGNDLYVEKPHRLSQALMPFFGGRVPA